MAKARPKEVQKSARERIEQIWQDELNYINESINKLQSAISILRKHKANIKSRMRVTKHRQEKKANTTIICNKT